MTEYIEREALLRNLSEDIEACGEEDSVCRPIAYGSILGLKMAVAYANTIPTADVVEVVRCKDCRYCLESDKTNRIFCTYHGDGIEFEAYPNDYCSHGVRRSEE